MDRIVLVGLDRPVFVHRVAGHVEHAAHDAFADGHGDRRAGIGDFHAALEPSVVDMAIARTQLSPRCCCTSRVSFIGCSIDLNSTVSAL